LEIAVFPVIEEDAIVTVPAPTATPPPESEIAVFPVIEEDAIVTVPEET